MKNMVILIGVGEMGSVFARGILKAGFAVYPLTRDFNLESAIKEVPDPEAIVVAVGEKDLISVLKSVPAKFHDRLVLLQNELLPCDWESIGIVNPTVISVWFEKKPGQDYKVLIPSPVFGPKASFIESALTSIKIPVKVLKNEDELLVELVLKNLYILTVNIVGLVVGGTVSQLWASHELFAREVASDVLDIQENLTGKRFNREDLIQNMLKAFDGDPAHKCLGRTAALRLARAIQQADQAGLKVSKLRELLTTTSGKT